MYRFANPGRFLRWSEPLTPWLFAFAAATIGTGLYLGLFYSPADYQQGDTVRIMYIHVPSAYMATAVYTMMAISSVIALIFKHPLADVAAKAAAPVGLVFTAATLITGSIWGKPMWGTYWAWDGRLTSVLVLFFIYLGHIALSNAFDEPQRGYRAAAILCIAGFVNIPIIRFSVDWWSTLHQPASLIRSGGTSIDNAFLTPLLTMMAGFTILFAALLLLRMSGELAAARVRVLQMQQVHREQREEEAAV